MFYSANGKSPQLSPTARIAQGARLVGQVPADGKQQRVV